jgi:hypothetical protein
VKLRKRENLLISFWDWLVKTLLHFQGMVKNYQRFLICLFRRLKPNLCSWIYVTHLLKIIRLKFSKKSKKDINLEGNVTNQ